MDLNNPPQLHAIWQQVWNVLQPISRVTPDQALQMVLATTDVQGLPQARVVVLRHADPNHAILRFHADALSPKIADMQHQPAITLCHYDAQTRVQMRLYGTATLTLGDAAAAAWQDVPEHARPNYGMRPPPGAAISAPHDYTRTPGLDRFGLATVRLTAVDVVDISNPRHHRAGFWRQGHEPEWAHTMPDEAPPLAPVAQGWLGCWRAP